MVQGKLPTSKPLFSSFCITSVKISEFALIIVVGRSDYWQTLKLSRFKFAWFIYGFVIFWNENCLSMFWLLITIILGSIFIIECPIRFSVWSLSTKGSWWRVIFNFETHWWKKSLKDSEKSSFFSSIKSFFISVILLFRVFID